MAISVMPPGEVPSSSVTQGRSTARCSSQAKPAQIAMSPTVPTATEPSQRGAVCRNSRLKRTPRLMPITSCATLTRAWGTADSSWPHMVRSEEHTSELQSPCNLVCRLLLEKKKTTLLLTAKDAVRWPRTESPQGAAVLAVEWEWVCGGPDVEARVLEGFCVNSPSCCWAALS